MKISILLEATANDLFRKIDALDAMINDTAATDGEKSNARTLKARLEKQLAANFPGASKPQSQSTPSYSTYAKNDFWTNMAKAASAAQDLENLKKNDPAAYKRKMEEKLRRMKDKLARARKAHLSGNVETAYNIRVLASELERFMQREFPEQYKETLKKREEASEKAYQARYKKKLDKEKAEKQKLKKSGKLTWKEVGNDYEEPLKKLYDNLVGTPLSGYKSCKIGEDYWKWKKGHAPKFMSHLTQIPTGKVREAWNKLDTSTQQILRGAIEKVNTMGYKNDGYTEAQKKSILVAMTPYAKPKA